MAKLTLADVTNILGNPTSAANTINSNNTLTETALENTLSRDGSSPNQMNADFDMNNHDILNADDINATRLFLQGQRVVPDNAVNAGNFVAKDDLASILGASLVGYGVGEVGQVLRTVESRLRERVSVKDFGVVGDGSDESLKIQAAINSGKSVYFPKPATVYKATGLTISTEGQEIYGDGYSSYIQCDSGVLFTVSASSVSIHHLRLWGVRTAGNQAIYLNAAAKCHIYNLDMQLWDVFVRWDNNGFHCYMHDCHTRNARSFGVQLDHGVGFFMSRVTYDTDIGTYSEPTAYIRMRNEGNVVANCDFIHPGQGVLIDPVSRNVEWCLFINTFIADSGSVGGNNAGIRITQNSNTFYVRGIFFDHVWSATNEKGLLIDGTGSADVDGIEFTDCMFHNNRREAVYIDFAAKNVSFKDCKFPGNSAAGAGASNTFYANKVNGLEVDNTAFNRRYRWATTPLYHIFIDALAQNVTLNNNRFDGNVVNGPFRILNTTTEISFARWTPFQTVNISNPSANVNLNTDGLGSVSQVMVVFDNVSHDSTGDLNLSFSSDGGSTFDNVSFERLQFTTGAEGYTTTLSGGRSITNANNIQGSFKFDNLNQGYKHLTYNSGLNAASGQGLMLMGTITKLTPTNYIRLAWSAGNLTGGTVRLFVR